MRARLVATVLAVLLLIPPAVAAAPSIGPGLVTGPEAHEAFETLARDGAVTFTDFESVPTGPHLKLKLEGPAKGITVKLRTTQLRYPLPPKRAPKDTPVLVLPYGFVSAPANHRLMGSNPGDAPDGQAKYKLVLSTPVSRAGLLRMFTTNSLTRFYDVAGTLLAEHQNTTNHEFVGYIAAGLEDRVKTIEFDGLPDTPKSKGNKNFHVGEVDDLYVGYGTAEAWAAGNGEPSALDDVVIDERPVDQFKLKDPVLPYKPLGWAKNAGLLFLLRALGTGSQAYPETAGQPIVVFLVLEYMTTGMKTFLDWVME